MSGPYVRGGLEVHATRNFWKLGFMNFEFCFSQNRSVPTLSQNIIFVYTPDNSSYITGSPFQFTVGPLSDGGAHRVHAGGSGLERGEQGQPCEFNVWTREAGPGSLAISVEGPSKAEIDFKDRKDGSCYVSYVVGEPGSCIVLIIYI